jgi:hypothetical protein
LAILGTLFAYYHTHPVIILKRLNITNYTEINIITFEIYILTKTRQSDNKSTILTFGSEIIASKYLKNKKINYCMKGKEIYRKTGTNMFRQTL